MNQIYEHGRLEAERDVLLRRNFLLHRENERLASELEEIASRFGEALSEKHRLERELRGCRERERLGMVGVS